MLITRISGCKGKTFLLNRKDLDEIKYNFYKKVDRPVSYTHLTLPTKLEV